MAISGTGDKITNVENIVGSAANDVFDFTNFSDSGTTHVDGGEGDDLLINLQDYQNSGNQIVTDSDGDLTLEFTGAAFSASTPSDDYAVSWYFTNTAAVDPRYGPEGHYIAYDSATHTLGISNALIVGAASPDRTVNDDVGGAISDVGGNINVSTSGDKIHITYDVLPCFRLGTKIDTLGSKTNVERLQEGDKLVLTSGGVASVKWIGHRAIHCRRHPRPQEVRPVRIAAGAFGDELPIRDLFLSPDHAIYVDDVLIPIKHLINGTTIVQEEVDEVTYYHVELDHHDVILAEGLPCESYLDTGRRDAFTNGGGATMLHPEFEPHPDSQVLWESLSYAPLVVVGPAIDRVRARLAAQALRLDRCGIVPSAGFRPAIEASTAVAA
jgi:hypothetical protein